MILSILVLALVTLQRLGELALARRNARRLLADGAREFGASHYQALILLHVAWLAGLWLLAHDRAIAPGWLAAYALLQVARIWVLASLGRRWTTRIIVLPAAPLVRSGPYRWLKHPNYVVLAAEVAVLPLVYGLWAYALAFSALNIAILTIRTDAENAALATQGGIPEQK